MDLKIRNHTDMTGGYRAERARGLYNVELELGTTFEAEFQVPDWTEMGPDGEDWTIGVVVGPSGSGKTSIGRSLGSLWENVAWPDDHPIVEAITPDGTFDDTTAALAAVGLGDVPSWLRPYPVLSNGEQFRANLARIIAEQPERVVIDEFTSVVDRQVAQVGAGAFAKSWRRGNDGKRKAVLLTCHYDILEWVNPDWILDTSSGELSWHEMSAHRSRWAKPEDAKPIVAILIGGEKDAAIYYPVCGRCGNPTSGKYTAGRCSKCYDLERREAGKTTKQQLAQLVRELKEERQCSDCTERSPLPYYQLDLDHREGETKVASVSYLINLGNREKLLEEIAKCDVVCSYCHRERTHARGYQSEAPAHGPAHRHDRNTWPERADAPV